MPDTDDTYIASSF